MRCAFGFDVLVHGAARMLHERARVHGGLGVGQVKKGGDSERRSRPVIQWRHEKSSKLLWHLAEAYVFTDGFTSLASKLRALSSRAVVDGGVWGFPTKPPQADSLTGLGLKIGASSWRATSDGGFRVFHHKIT